MKTSLISLRVDKKFKADAQAVAKELGLSLSALVNGLLKHVVRTGKVEFELGQEDLNNIVAEAKKKRFGKNVR
jgi:addiction module RelB/DinJ family antitoxin